LPREAGQNSRIIKIEVLENLGIKEGEVVNLVLDSEQRRVIISPVEKPFAMAGVDEEFARQVETFIQQYRPALEELAK
jgi:antitoxin MazE